MGKESGARGLAPERVGFSTVPGDPIPRTKVDHIRPVPYQPSTRTLLGTRPRTPVLLLVVESPNIGSVNFSSQ
eukprot:2806117-Rhodomonas_salina.1